MGKAKIDFASGQNSSNEPLGGAIPQSVNVLVDGVGAVHLRPGISAWDEFDPSPGLDATTSVDGISAFKGDVVYVTSDRKIHAQLGTANGVDLSDSTAASQLDAETRPVLVPARDRIVIAGGGRVQKWEGAGHPLSERLAGGAPFCTHIVSIAQRLVVNPRDSSGQIQWSEAGNDELWLGEFKELESRPDPLPAIYDNTGEIIGLGTATVQTLDPDVDETFISARTWTSGIGAPYSFAQIDETFGFLDSKRRIQLSNGRAYESISDPNLTETLKKLPVTEDCWAFRMSIGSWDLLGWHFPTAARTFVFDTSLKRWYEWRGHLGGQWTAWMAKSHFHWEDENLNLIGLGDGTIAKMDATAVTDMGQPIVAEAVSGFSNDGTDNWKQHLWTKFTFRRGLGEVGELPGPRAQLYWRDGLGAWQGPEDLELGDGTDRDPILVVRTLGMYQTRQWRLRFSDSVPLVLIDATTTFEEAEQ
jgi:hypothetical protein